MKTGIQIGLWILSIFFAFMIYRSISQPIKFDKIKQERYKGVISKLKDIRDAEEAHRVIKGSYQSDFNKLISFIENSRFVITQQRDSSYTYYNETYRIDMVREVKLIDTLGYESVKDSLFKGSDRYKTMMNVPFSKNNEKFTLAAAIVDKNGYRIPVFEAKVAKNVVLYDQPQDLIDRENEMVSVEEIPGTEIIVGSLVDVSTTGNWPQIYDTKGRQ